ncbi:universal stress protein [Kribbella shirazensis]|uniref:Nucleotide-binding universal stress UspA family protein n=1 Tax=Kribbella shirazensis TaxID=1105143 RepID=A0A7X5VDK0_9ACTN|nr:universal stress protein [Kribbella shirazensis]NIK59218.1 nucleotide-binding universal stress UspA family protein [Kribbella shirazensis]
MTARTIAVGVDGSWADNGAVDWALHESDLSEAPTRVLHVLDDRPRVRPYVDFPGARAAAKQLVADVGAYLDERSAEPHSGAVLSGPPAQTLAGATTTDRMLVIGRHGRGVFGRLLIGSTAERVAYESETAVVVVPPKWTPAPPDAPVVVGVDDLERCGAAVDFAVSLAVERGAPIRLVHIWDVAKMFTGDEAVDTVDLARLHHTQHVDMIVRECREKYPGTVFGADLRQGHPVAGLIDAVSEADAQLLLVGGRTHGRILSAVLGGTARGILHHATCPVAIVHQRHAQH